MLCRFLLDLPGFRWEILSSVPSVLLLSPSTELSISINVLCSSKISIRLFFIGLFLYWDCSFFVSRVFLIAHWSIFTMAALKSLLENPNISVISVLASIYLSIQIEIFLLLGISEFRLRPGHFGFYETQNLIQSFFCFRWLLLTLLQQGKEWHHLATARWL